jgi:fibronectin-binding autotransporter adhesin
MKTLLRNFAVVAIVLAACGTAHAQKSWNVASGNWNNAGNWSPSGVPASGNAVAISNDGTATLDTTLSGLTSLTIGTSSSVLQKDNSTSGRTITMGTAALSGLVTNSGTIRYGQGTGEFRIVSGPAGVNNSGLITADVVGQELRLTMSTTNGVDLVNGGTLRADGGLLRLSGSSTFDLPNTGGVLSAINGGTINFSSGGRVTGGTVSVAAGSTLLHSRTNDGTDLTDVTVTNAGRMFTESPTNTGFRIKFLGTTALTNSGTLEFLTSGTSTPTVFGEAASTATITNQATGIIRVANNNTAGTATAYFLNSTSDFTNLGGIEIKSNAALATGSSQFRSTAVNFSNAGSFLVDGPVSSILMTGRTFTQTAGALSLINGGSMTASSVLINGGTLLGTGTIAAPTTIGGILSPGNAGIGTLTVSSNVTWNAGNAWLFQLGTPAASLNDAITGSDADLLSLTGAFTQGAGSTFNFDFSGGSDGWYKLVDYTSTNFTPGTNTSFAATNVPAGKSANFVVDVGSTALYVQIVPEPSTLALAGLGIGLAGLIASRRRRRG